MTSLVTAVIVNPHSRSGRLMENWSEREAQIQAALDGGVVEITKTTAEDHGFRMISEKLAQGIRRILVVGGDGTVSQAVQALMRSPAEVAQKAELMILPAGRGDDFFKSVAGRKFPNAEEAWDFGLRILREGRPKAVDIGSIQWPAENIQHYFMNVVSLGYPGLVVQKVLNPSPLAAAMPFSKSSWTYLVNSTIGMASYRPIPGEIKIDDRPFFSGLIFSGFILNGKYNGGGMVWSNAARFDDGILELVMGEPRNPISTLMTFPRMWSGDWSGVKGIHTGRGRKIEVRFDPDFKVAHPYFEIDGDQPQGSSAPHAIFEVKPGAIWIRSLAG